METVGHNNIAINFVWTLIAGFLVMFMQAGFAMVETGFTRAKNAAHTMSMNFMVYPLGMIGYWICGFAIQMGGFGALALPRRHAAAQQRVHHHLFGKTFGLFGKKGFFLSGDTYDVGVFALFLFQMVFMDTAATIPTGSMAERWKFSAFVVFGFFMSMFLYPLFGNWVWGGGWLATLGEYFGLGNGQWTSPARGRPHDRRRDGPGGGDRARTAHRQVHEGRQPVPIPGTTSRWRWPARSSWPSAGSASIPGSTLAGGDLRIARRGRPTRCWPARRCRSRDVLHVAAARQARSVHVV